MKKGIFIILLLFATNTLKAQTYKYELGGGVGIGFYMGDANPNKPFRKPGAAFDLAFRWNINYRWALKCGLSTATIKGATDGLFGHFPNNAEFSFKRQLIDLGIQAEFNFFNYGVGQSYLGTKRFSPYIVAGIGLTAIPKAGDSYYSISIPLGFGVKYKVGKRVNLMLEFTMRKTLGDKMEGKDLDDPYNIESSALKNTDWYSYTMFSVTYDFGQKKKICNNIN
ncbi:MAG: DUF6089 family protein [Bacteroidales bacterium]